MTDSAEDRQTGIEAPEISRLTTSHGELAVTEWPGGNDLPLALLVHGVDGARESWASLAAAVGGRRRLVAMDLRGRGASSTAGPWGVEAHADDVIAVLERLIEVDERQPTLVGHSFGGHVAGRVAARRPDLVRELLLVDGGPPRVVPDGVTPGELADSALANIVPNLGTKPYSVAADAVVADFHSMVTDESGTNSLAGVGVPITLLRAELGVAPPLPPVVPDVVIDGLRASGLDLDDRVVANATHFSIAFDPAPELVDALIEHPDEDR